MAFQIGLSGGFSKTKGGRRRLSRAFRGAGILKPPAGTYDPGLDASQRAAGRGFNDLRQDLDRDGERASTEFVLGSARLGEDEAFQREGIARGFRELGVQQAEQAAAMGVGAGGALTEAAAKRQANEGVQQGRLSQMFARAREDLGTGFQYGQDDRAVALARGGRENTFYGQDVADQRYFQAAQSGWRPAAAPKPKPKKKGKR